MDWILNNWTELALAAIAFADVVVSFHPKWTGKGLGYIRAIVLAITATAASPKKGGES